MTASGVKEMENSGEHFFTVGELANRVGVTVRTLQYYDKTGLLKAKYSPSGRRIYSNDDVLRLQQIMFLKSFGFPLAEIKQNIQRQNSAGDLEQSFTRQHDMVVRQLENLTQMARLLKTIIDEIHLNHELGLEKLLTIMELMKQGNPYSFVFRYFGNDQVKAINNRFASTEFNNEYVENAQQLFTRLQELYQQNADPASQEGQELAANWWKMTNEFTSGDTKMLNTLLSAGMDIDHWPKEAKPIQDAIQNFLTKALAVYFETNNIHVPGMEGNQHE